MSQVLLDPSNSHDVSLCLLKVIRAVEGKVVTLCREADGLLPKGLQDAAVWVTDDAAHFDLYQILHTLWKVKRPDEVEVAVKAEYIAPVTQAAPRCAKSHDDIDPISSAADEQRELGPNTVIESTGTCPVYKQILMERLMFQPKATDLEDPRGFAVYMAHIQELRRAGLLEFLEPRVLNERLNVTDKSVWCETLTFDEVALFAALWSSRLWHEYYPTSKRASALMKNWYIQFLSVVFNKVNYVIEHQLQIQDPTHNPQEALSIERQDLFRQWLGVTEPDFVETDVCDTSPIRQRLSTDPTLFTDPLSPQWFDEDFEKYQRIRLSTHTPTHTPTHTLPLATWLWDISKTRRDFSTPWNQQLLRIYLSQRRDMSRNPFVYCLYEAIKRRHVETALMLIDKFTQLKGHVFWANFFDKQTLARLSRDCILTEESLLDIFAAHNWGDPHTRFLDVSTFRLDDYRDEKHNLVTCFHAAASSCRKTSKYKSLAGVQDSIIETDQGDEGGLSGEIDRVEGLCAGVRLMKALVFQMGTMCSGIDRDGLNPVFYACVSGCVDCLEWLYEQGCPIHTLDIQKRSAFYCAACVGELDSCVWMVDKGYDFRTDASLLKRTALCKATWGDYPDVVEYLLSLGLDPCPLDSKNRTPLHTAVWGPAGGRSGTKIVGSESAKESIDCARALLNAPGGDRALVMFDQDGCAPIHICASTNAVKCISLLCEKGADIDIRSRTSLQWTALMCAAYRGHLEMNKQCIQHGASVLATDTGGRTCLEYAIKGGGSHLLSYLIGETETALGHTLPASRVSTLIHSACLEAQVDCLNVLLSHPSVQGDVWESLHLVCGGQAEDPDTVTPTHLPDMRVSPLDTIILGQRVVPASQKTFRSLPFPPFRNYRFPEREPNAFLFTPTEIAERESPFPPPDNTLNQHHISPFVELHCGKKQLHWRLRKVKETQQKEVELVVSPSMLGCFSLVLNYLVRHTELTSSMDLATHVCVSFQALLKCVSMSLKRHLKCLTGMLIKKGVTTRARPSPVSSSPEFILSKAGITITESHTPHSPFPVCDLDFKQALFSHELQKVARNIFLPLPILLKFLRIFKIEVIDKLQTNLKRAMSNTLVEALLQIEAHRQCVEDECRGSRPVEAQLAALTHPHMVTDILDALDTATFAFSPVNFAFPVSAGLWACTQHTHDTHSVGDLSLFEQAVLASDIGTFKFLINHLKTEALDPLLTQEARRQRVLAVVKRPLIQEELPRPIRLFVERMAVASANVIILAIYVNNQIVCSTLEQELLCYLTQSDLQDEFECNIRSGRYSFGITSPSRLLPKITWIYKDHVIDDVEAWALERGRFWDSVKAPTLNPFSVSGCGEVCDDVTQDVSPSYVLYVDTHDKFDEFLVIVKGLLKSADLNKDPRARFMGVDLEFSMGNGDLDITCLVQLAYRDHVFVLDPFYVYEDMANNLEFQQLFRSDEVICVFHSGHTDMKRLLEDFDLVVRNVWDTSRVHEVLVRMGCASKSSISLEALTSLHFPAVSLDKSLQRSEWRCRPLTQAMIDYAAMDALVLTHIACSQQRTLHSDPSRHTLVTAVYENHCKFKQAILTNGLKTCRLPPATDRDLQVVLKKRD
eukprot:Blabericola_migrator_1__10005@NODE_553_length_7646_cov_26_017417_g416_i0_p1_GENE_NODE_553_length_7646_cov_26_017417_g416_i0NODE_553_length_7646_cov_26_017417_g416_i0_p1_ORF_typecomplete_len1605_score399_66Ank_2/PF12796_7/8_8e02Ank_2/PF12796_7/1_2e06Ank_2/PF12796_7/7_6e06Ank_2/PF12796_7/7_5e05Ank_2/PF12796_7/1_1e08Ank_2/PF12796_7/7_9Ank_4/PF13637_6/1_2e03Ank_4/PF13637_6/7_5e05Ank_4/PF13637_6/8_6e05Ank_4/PF13637_6/0_079Ank_4/PF13637_6/9_4e10Ank_4/PF13637_6/8_2e09Ank_4/PF13637_6/6_8Ank_5/PF13857_6/